MRRAIIFISLFSLILASCTKEEKLSSKYESWVFSKMLSPDHGYTPAPYYGLLEGMMIGKDNEVYMYVVKYNQTDTFLVSARKDYLKLVNDSLRFNSNGSICLYVSSHQRVVKLPDGRYADYCPEKFFSDKTREKLLSIIVNNEFSDEKILLASSENESQRGIGLLLYGIIALLLGSLAGYAYWRRKMRKKRQHSDVEETTECSMCEASDNQPTEDEFFKSEYYLMLRQRVAGGYMLKPDDWEELMQKVRLIHPDFMHNLLQRCKMSDMELNVCILIKLRFSPAEIANALAKERNSISSIRSRLYKKAFDKNGSSKDWDDFIFSL